jgi:O-antigen ligase
MIGLIFIIWDLYVAPSDLRAGLQAYVLGAYISIGSGIANFVANNFTQGFRRYRATNFDPGDVGIIIALGIPMAWYLVASAKEEQSPNNPWKIINGLYIPAALFAIAISGTRSALIACLPGLAYAALSFPRMRRATQMLLLAAMVSAGYLLFPLVPDFSIERLASIGNEIQYGTLNGRRITWQEGFDVLVEHPFLGIGAGAFKAVTESGQNAHNVFVSIAVSVGLIGLLFFGIIVAMCTYLAIVQALRGNFVWLVLLMVWTAGAMVLNWEQRKQTWLVLTWIFAGFYLSEPEREQEETQITAPVEDLFPELTPHANGRASNTSYGTGISPPRIKPIRPS